MDNNAILGHTIHCSKLSTLVMDILYIHCFCYKGTWKKWKQECSKEYICHLMKKSDTKNVTEWLTDKQTDRQTTGMCPMWQPDQTSDSKRSSTMLHELNKGM